MVNNEDPNDEFDSYSGGEIIEYKSSKTPLFLKITYSLLPIWGLITFYLFWDGTFGWLDRGAWQGLQQLSNTTRSKELINQ
jgi:hypothetical protein